MKLNETKKFFLLIILPVLVVLLGGKAFALDGRAQASELFPESVRLDNVNYTRRELQNIFKAISINPEIQFNEYNKLVYEGKPPSNHCPLPMTIRTEPCGTEQEYKIHYPWLYDYLYHPEGSPKAFVLTKWMAPVRISVGYPNNLSPINASQDHLNFCTGVKTVKGFSDYAPLCLSDDIDRTHVASDANTLENSKKFNEAIFSSTQALLPMLKKLTGLSVSYSPDDQTANVRIILENKSGAAFNGFKRALPRSDLYKSVTGGFNIAQNTIPYRLRIEELIDPILRFTPFESDQVDGYILRKSDGSIGMAFCFIPDDLSSDLMKSLIDECLIRSLGFPNSSKIIKSGMFKIRRSSKAMQWKIFETPKISFFTELDQFLIKTLYRDDVKIGLTSSDIDY